MSNTLVNNNLVIDNIFIRQDSDGRYCLNDLHKAAGGESRHQPGKWLENQQTKDLVKALMTDTGNPVSENSNPLNIIKGGSGIQGTFVSEDLVYDYAMWISAEFKLKVIRAYRSLVETPAPVQPAPVLHPMTEADLVSNAVDNMIKIANAFGFKGNQALLMADKGVKKLTGQSAIALLEAPLISSSKSILLTPTDIGIQINKDDPIGPKTINKKLKELGFQDSISTSNGTVWVLTKKGEDFAEVLDVGKKHSDGTPIKQIKWRFDIVDELIGHFVVMEDAA
jgi:hypothetical protein